MTPPKTIDINMSNIIFEEQDPVGLMPVLSAKGYLEALRERLRERFPKARVFLRWSPSSREEPDVLTLPPTEEAEAVVEEIAKEVIDESDEWLTYDESVRAAFAS